MDFPRVLVLGATGRIGGILRKCWPEGQGLWQSRTDHGGHRDRGDQNWITLDPLAEPEALVQAARTADSLLCLSGVTPIAAANMGANMDDNVTLALAAVRAGAKAGVPVLLSSSAAVYGNQTGVLDETCPLAPLNAYGQAKARMEREAQALAQNLGARVTSLRIGNIAGVDAILGGWRAGFALDRFADGATPRRSYIGAVTLARVLGDLARCSAGGYTGARDLPAVLNVAAPGMIEMGALLDAAGLGWTPRDAPQTAIPAVCLSTERLETVTSFDRDDSTPAAMVAEWRSLAPAPL